mmetsp:Transcript_16633/g.47907  ORF Transcript_16633/g.47907 Transcript_16633/m.47907 type:complete len:124 (+) Transcript_16633:413-784(+)
MMASSSLAFLAMFSLLLSSVELLLPMVIDDEGEKEAVDTDITYFPFSPPRLGMAEGGKPPLLPTTRCRYRCRRCHRCRNGTLPLPCGQGTDFFPPRPSFPFQDIVVGIYMFRRTVFDKLCERL